MLHVTNGDSAARLLERSGLRGEVLPWREMWTDGPARPEWDGEAEIGERADYLEAAFAIPGRLYAETCERQLARLKRAALSGEEIVLWFEYDLFDQALLASLLDGLSRWGEPGGPGLRVSLINAERADGVADFRGLGQLTPKQLRGFWPQRRRAAAHELAAGRRAWRAFASADPTAVQAWIRLEGGVLPVMARAFAFHLRRFPSLYDGLGIAERETLAALLSGGPERPDRLFGRIGGTLALYGMGDLTFWGYLRRMREAGLIEVEVEGARAEAGEGRFPLFGDEQPPEWERLSVRIADPGRRRLEAGACRNGGAAMPDAADTASAGRWLGGVRLDGDGRPSWRYAGEEPDGVPGMIFR